MKVLILTNMFPIPDRPSFGIFVKEQVDDLRQLGVDASVQFVNGVASNWNYVRGSARLRRSVRAMSYDLVHAHYGLTGAVALTQRQVPVVTTFHGSDCNGERPWQTIVSWGVARLSTAIFVSAELASAVRCEGAPVIPVAVDLDRFRPVDRRTSRSSLGWPEDDVVALLPGSRSVRRKRADLFDAALDHARRSVPGLRGTSMEGLSRDQVAVLMNAVDVTVMTSNYEGSPIAVKESLACGTPVVSVPVGDVATLLAGLPGCAVVPREPARIGEAIVAALRADGPDDLRRRVEPYGRPAIASRIIDVYGRVLAARAG